MQVEPCLAKEWAAHLTQTIREMQEDTDGQGKKTQGK